MTPSRWSFRTRILLGLVGAFLLVFAIVLGQWILAGSRLRAEVAKLKAEGLPTTAAEVNDYYKVPEGVPDTTADWLAAIAAVRAGGLETRGAGLPVVGTGPTPVPPPGSSWKEREASKTLVESLAGPLALARKASVPGGQVRFPVDFSQGINTLLTNTQDARNVARLLVLDAHVAAHDGDTARVLEDITAILALSDALRGEPTLISQLVRIAMYTIGCDAIETLAPHCSWNDAQLAGLQESVRRARPREEMAQALSGERAIGLSSLDSMTLGPLSQGNAELLLDMYRQTIQSFNDPWPETLQQTQGEMTRIKSLAGNSVSRVRYMGVLLLMPAMEAAAWAGARCEARQRCTNAALAALRHQLKHGQPPATLDQIDAEFLGVDAKGELLTDPFDGKPLRVRRMAGELIIYSIGQNGRDDGGQLKPSESQQPGDVGFALKKPGEPASE